MILDVVYNHTAEGNHLGPILSFKGIDNTAYYRLVDDDRRYYYDTTGTGNSLNMRHPHVLQLIMDSLRYWVIEMHVDGFRFDLAATLARQFHDVDRLSAFFDLIQQDPVVSQVKLIAEPWDLGEGGYQVGNFPPLWSEWNGKYRDTVRDFWRGEDQTARRVRLPVHRQLRPVRVGRAPAVGQRQLRHRPRRVHPAPTSTSYNEKHNEANGEGNADGESHNRSWNCGVEGPTDDPEVLALRARQRRNFLATLLLSQGIPMILGGDEMGRTQGGNNNAYCQDNEISWFDWERRSTARSWPSPPGWWPCGASTPVFRRRRWFQGRPLHGKGIADLAWFRPDGTEMEEQDWESGFAKSMAVFLNGERHRHPPTRGATGWSTTASSWSSTPTTTTVDFTLPPDRFSSRWVKVVDTADALAEGEQLKAGDSMEVPGRSLAVLRATGPG